MPAAGPIDRQDLWPVPIWEADLSWAVDDIGPVLDAAFAHIDATELADHPMRQSSNFLERGLPELRPLVAAVEGVARAAAEDGLRVGPRQSLTVERSWLVRIDGADDFTAEGGSADLLHAHSTCVLSSVTYLQVPSGYEGSEEAGTTFRAPHAAMSRLLSRNVSVLVPARTLHCVVFPSWLEHCPTPPRTPGPYDQPRLVMATDFRLFG